MNSSDNIILKVHRIDEDGTVSSIQYEEDFITQEIISKTAIPSDNINFNQQYNWSFQPESKVNLSFRYLEPDDSAVTVIKIGGVEDLNPLNYATEISTVLNDPDDCKPFMNNALMKPKRESKIPNIPTMIRCQNCDTNFPTKYQYQRHQCEFNAEKVVLKPNADIKDIDKGMRIKYSCTTCGKEFVSKNNLERHQASHDKNQENVCEHCNKQFVSENRLRIHKENHCKKAGDISKFYRSDVTVWRCIKCNQVFATPGSANRHTDTCGEVNDMKREINLMSQQSTDDLKLISEDADALISSVSELLGNKRPNISIDNAVLSNRNVEKVLTELLLQCEFCNRTYADKIILLAHQKTHSTEVNYECVTCRERFDSYCMAAKHWLTKCSDEANLFYLPKMTYCEYCDRTFKSHELLYNHKAKKKHYAPKLHCVRELETLDITEDNGNNLPENKDVIVKLIEEVLTTMDMPIHKDMEEVIDIQEGDILNGENKENENNNNEIASIKKELLTHANMQMDTFGEANQESQEEPEKKKRGRKRKWPKQNIKAKRLTATVEEGYKYQCERCIKVFNNVVELENHHNKEHASNYACDECGQVVHSAKALLIHCRAHQSLKPYVCEQCGRSYSQTSHLWQHMRFHQGIKPFACPHEGCEARYTIRPDLKDHIRKVHTRERPFKCAVCNKCFLTGSVYYQHRLIHTNDRRYGCDICEKRFFRADALNNHRRIHTDERPYPCEICGREFRQKGDRNKHVRTQHPE